MIMKNENGNEVIINKRCTASKTFTLALILPKRIKAMVASKIKTDQITRWVLLGFLEPLSVNILNTKTAESTDVIRKLINRKIEVIFKNVANGYCSKNTKMDENTFPNWLLYTPQVSMK